MKSGTRSAAAIVAVVLVTAGCEVAREGKPAYALAQQCVSVRSHDGGAALRADATGTYSFASGEGDPFFLKPTGLRRFLLYDEQGRFAGLEDGAMRALGEPGDETVWKIREVDLRVAGLSVASRHTLISLDDRRLARDGERPVLRPRADVLDADSAAFELVREPDERCLAFPEATIDAVVDPTFHEPRDPAEPIVGYADVHAHFGFPRALAGLALAGESFHRFGVEHALGDCEEIHGPNGNWDFLGRQGGSGSHDTTGYPSFPAWPTKNAYTHNQAYYRWIERAYLSGLRVAVTFATGNPSFCQALATARPRLAKGDCSPASTVELQTRYMYEMQDYVDAQSGGPGKGWFRVVTSPAEARAVIADNKLAVVLGVEYGTLFDCRIGEEEKCTLKYVDEELAKIHALGVRAVYPVHRFENGFGGTRLGGGDGNAWMNLANKMVTGDLDHLTDLVRPRKLLFRDIGGQYWEVERCPEGVRGSSNLPDMQDWVDRSFPDFGPLDPLLQAVLLDKLGPYPDYGSFEPGEQLCNPRRLTDQGRLLLRRLMERGMIISIDHMSWPTLLETLDIVEAARYSGVISDHSWTDTRNAELTRVLALGGLMGPMKGTPSGFARQIEEQAERMSPFPYVEGVAMGSDVMGVTGQASSDSDIQIDYPFTSYDGLVTFTQPGIGTRSLDYRREGVAHYGLFAEWVENLRKADERDGRGSLPIFMRSAEAYVQMWERAEAWAEASGTLP